MKKSTYLLRETVGFSRWRKNNLGLWT